MDEPHSQIPQYRPSAQAGTLEAAIAHLRRGLRTDGAYEGVSEWETAEHQWRQLDSWCFERGLIVPEAFGPVKEGGHEHDVRFDDDLRRWIKYTKPNHAGYAVEIVGNEVLMLPATPLQYLDRWKSANAVFADDAELLGIWRSVNGLSIVISQRDITGESPTWEEVETFFVGRFEMAELSPPKYLGGYSSKCYLSGRLAVFDVRPLNCVRTEAGLIVPFDVIPQLFSHADASVLRAYRVKK